MEAISEIARFWVALEALVAVPRMHKAGWTRARAPSEGVESGEGTRPRLDPAYKPA